jgi:hypothetical protein
MTSLLMSLRLGARATRVQLTPTWVGAVSAAALLAVGLVSLLETETIGSPGGARLAQAHVLRGAVFGLVLPLVAFVLSERAGGTLAGFLRLPWARYGADRRAMALGRLAVMLLTSAGIGVALALVGFVLTRLGSGALAPPAPLASELLALIWLGVAGGAAYAALFAAASLWGRHWGRAALLLADWLLGSGVGAAALPFPRSHLRALLGGSPVLELGDWSSSSALVVIIVAGAALYAARVPR